MRKVAVPLATVVVLVALTSFPAVAGAHSHWGAYPPSTTTTLRTPTAVSQSETTTIGSSFTTEICGFLPYTNVPYTFTQGTSNNIPTGTFTTDSDGCFTITIRVFDPHVTINGGSLLPAAYDDNIVVATGTGANGAPRTYTLVFNITPSTPAVPASAGNPTSTGSAAGSSSSGSSSSSSGSSGTSSSGSSSRSSSGSSSSLAFTGADIAGMAVGGVLLVLAGASLVVVWRRRAAHG